MAPSPDAPRIRPARAEDRAALIDFNARLAHETEGKELDRAVLARGVDAALADPHRLRYWVAASPEDDRILGQAAITREWSDWRNGWVWWLQSVYVIPESRRQGIFKALYLHIRDQAWAARDVIGLRLYVEEENLPAQRTYQALGMHPGGYHVYEELWPERFSSAES